MSSCSHNTRIARLTTIVAIVWTPRTPPRQRANYENDATTPADGQAPRFEALRQHSSTPPSDIATPDMSIRSAHEPLLNRKKRAQPVEGILKETLKLFCYQIRAIDAVSGDVSFDYVDVTPEADDAHSTPQLHAHHIRRTGNTQNTVSSSGYHSSRSTSSTNSPVERQRQKVIACKFMGLSQASSLQNPTTSPTHTVDNRPPVPPKVPLHRTHETR